ncbi:helicase associated domain-containing protein, partial [Desulfobulbus sp. TB]|nr:helicase associated domain-containing protein [Desulfobulbus sp. TB]
FKEKHGHCNVPFQYIETPKLGAFVNAMRSHKHAGTLSKKRITLLEHIGFEWRVKEAGNTDKWEERYIQLLYFKDEHGHCDVPYNYPDNPQLANWVRQQRQRKKSGKLSAKREKMLEEVSFEWGSHHYLGGVNRSELWALRYNELVKFKQQHGHCKVPTNYADNPQLGKWVSRQRQQRKQDKLTPERLQMLEEVGFLWSAS